MSGGPQAVRLPKPFRLEADEVRIRSERATVDPEPLDGDWTWLADLHSLGPLDPDAVDAVGLPATDQSRPDLDALKWPSARQLSRDGNSDD